MKTTFTTLLVLLWLVAPTAFAQQSAQVGDVQEFAAERKAELKRHIPAFLRAKAQVDVISRVTAQTWVETDWENDSQTRYSYSGGQQTEVLRLNWEDNDWVNSTRTINTFSGGLLVTQEDSRWEDGAWVSQFRTLNSYDGGELTESIYQEWVEGEWVNSLRSRINRDDGAIISWESDDWNGSDWVPSDRSTMEQSGDDVLFTTETWVESEWVNDSRIVYPDITIAELFELFTDFVEDVEIFFGYAFSFRLPDYLTQLWEESEWVDESQQTTEYDAQGRATTITTELWEDGNWVGAGRQIRNYDNGELESTNLQSFDEEEGEWSTYLTETYTYYDNGLLETVLHQFDFGVGAVNSMLYTLEWTSTSTASETDDLPVGFTLEPVYPNPFNPTANVTYHVDASAHVTVSVYDVLGRHVATLADGPHAAGRYEVTFDAGDRPSGLYIVRLEAPTHRQSQTVSLIR